MNYPKILIIGECFHHKSGGGITLSNLFADWPKESLFNAADSYSLNKTDFDSCFEYYQFGNLENHYFLPWFVRKFIPHPILNNNSISSLVEMNYQNEFKNSESRKTSKKLLVKIFTQFSFFLGIYPIFCRRKVSIKFINWIENIKPDYIYTQLSDITSIRFIKELSNKTSIPLCLHIMDDWPSTYSRPGLLYYYWKKRIDIEFRELINRSKIFMSISEGMSDEFMKRYGKPFIPFHNPIDIEIWGKHVKNNFSINNDDIRVLYSGRIGLGISKSLLTVIKTIESLRKEGMKITLELQVPSSNHNLYEKYVQSGAVKYNPVVSYDEIPHVFSKADILILPYDFTNQGLKFIKYSMPTKASEFMASGTPILLYCSEEVFLNKYFTENKTGLVVSDRSKSALKNSLLNLIENEGLRSYYSKNALNFAKSHFDSCIVRDNFLKIFEKGLK